MSQRAYYRDLAARGMPDPEHIRAGRPDPEGRAAMTAPLTRDEIERRLELLPLSALNDPSPKYTTLDEHQALTTALIYLDRAEAAEKVAISAIAFLEANGYLTGTGPLRGDVEEYLTGKGETK